MQRLLIVIAALLLTACASLRPPVDTSGRIALQPGQGAAMIAVTMTTLAFDDTGEAAVDIVGPGGKATVMARELTDYIRAPGDESDGKGRLFVVPLPAGDYRIVQAWGGWTEDIGGWRMYRHVNFPMNTPFTVAPGRVTYLGQVQLNLNFQSDMTVADTRRRDLNHAQVLWGVTDTSNIDFHPISGAQR
ncbi:MAG TPA: hypothetical protein VLC08_16215 [Chitinolyticbacter sp.]|uniref:hypothetical protein n=1 Tax=Chitinolyticbacter albus TaxID=2961951 RepID=UPI002108BD6D|nr:hypothetical protein [Chitinolyticbacter albus]HSC81905.1 hypothetical protein [Chitinolyticbacter sp.]